MPNLVLHPFTERELAHFVERPNHALLVVGAEGMGKFAVAEHLTRAVLDLAEDKNLSEYPYFRHLAPDGPSISIDTVRDLLQFTKLKITGAQQAIQRVIIIDQAHTMTGEAQNALLKLLEEPPAGTLFILTVTNEQALLPTIRSRAPQLHLKQPKQEALLAYFTTQGFDEQKVRQAYLMSGGLPGLIHALLHDSDHPLAQAASRARELLRAKTFERLAEVDALAKQKADCVRVLFMLQQMAQAAMEQAAGKGSTQAVRQWQKILSATYDTEQTIAASAQPKLALTNLMLVL